MLPWRIINHVQADQITKVPTTDVPLDLYLSVLGMPGQTAYHGLLDIGQPKAGDTVSGFSCIWCCRFSCRSNC